MNWSLATILSATTGVLLGDFGDLQALFDYMTQDSVFTHQMLRLAEPVKVELLRQHPQLEEIDASNVNKENWKDFLAEQAGEFGLALWVDPLGTYEHRDPLEEAVEIFGEDKVWVAPLDYPLKETA